MPSYGPKIVTDKLVLLLDPLNTKCYPGSGTTVNNITNYSYTGTMSGSGISADASNGWWQFDGINSNVNFPNSDIAKRPSVALGESSPYYLTYECWFKVEGDQSDGTSQMRLMSTDASDWHAIVTDGTYASNNLGLFWYAGDGLRINIENCLQRDTWHHVVGTHYTDLLNYQSALYLDGQLIGSDNGSTDRIGTGSSRQLSIGSNTESTDDPTNDTFNGKISQIKIYGKVLSATEANQNYQAHRGRFS